jgi:hypothetical protein
VLHAWQASFPISMQSIPFFLHPSQTFERRFFASYKAMSVLKLIEGSESLQTFVFPFPLVVTPSFSLVPFASFAPFVSFAFFKSSVDFATFTGLEGTRSGVGFGLVALLG